MFKIVISGWDQCVDYAMSRLVADHLTQKLPNFHFEAIGKPLLDWKKFLAETNIKHQWGHLASPLIWKELEYSTDGNVFYIGDASQFFEYLHCYYNFDVYLTKNTFPNLIENNQQLEKNNEVRDRVFKDSVKRVYLEKKDTPQESEDSEEVGPKEKKEFNVVISGMINNMMESMIDALTKLATRLKLQFNIYLYSDEYFNQYDIKYRDDSTFVNVRQIYKINKKLTNADLLIVLNHIPLDPSRLEWSQWLTDNGAEMMDLSELINLSHNKKLKIMFPNLGPSCFNATMLSSALDFIPREHIVVATTDVAADVMKPVAESTAVDINTMFSPPVWGFVGVNHVIDVKNMLHKYYRFHPYDRYLKIKQSTLKIGLIHPQLRNMEYLLHWNDHLWEDVLKEKQNIGIDVVNANKASAAANIIENWFFSRNSEKVASVGVFCNGTYGLQLDGFFSQPCRIDSSGNWIPSADIPIPEDPVKISYLCEVARSLLDKQKCTCSSGLSDEDFERSYYCFCNRTVKPVCKCIPEGERNRNMHKGCFCKMAASNPDLDKEYCFCSWEPVCRCGYDCFCNFQDAKEVCDCSKANICLCTGEEKKVCVCKYAAPCVCSKDNIKPVCVCRPPKKPKKVAKKEGPCRCIKRRKKKVC